MTKLNATLRLEAVSFVINHNTIARYFTLAGAGSIRKLFGCAFRDHHWLSVGEVNALYLIISFCLVGDGAGNLYSWPKKHRPFSL